MYINLFPVSGAPLLEILVMTRVIKSMLVITIELFIELKIIETNEKIFGEKNLMKNISWKILKFEKILEKKLNSEGMKKLESNFTPRRSVHYCFLKIFLKMFNDVLGSGLGRDLGSGSGSDSGSRLAEMSSYKCSSLVSGLLSVSAGKTNRTRFSLVLAESGKVGGRSNLTRRSIICSRWTAMISIIMFMSVSPHRFWIILANNTTADTMDTTPRMMTRSLLLRLAILSQTMTIVDCCVTFAAESLILPKVIKFAKNIF